MSVGCVCGGSGGDDGAYLLERAALNGEQEEGISPPSLLLGASRVSEPGGLEKHRVQLVLVGSKDALGLQRERERERETRHRKKVG